MYFRFIIILICNMNYCSNFLFVDFFFFNWIKRRKVFFFSNLYNILYKCVFVKDFVRVKMFEGIVFGYLDIYILDKILFCL